MNYPNPALFVLTDAASIRGVVHQAFKTCEFHPRFLDTAAEYFALARVGTNRPTCLVVDADLPDIRAVAEFQHQVEQLGCDNSVVFVSRRLDIAESVRAMKAGAIDYLIEPIDAAALVRAVRTAINACWEAQVQGGKLAELRQRYARLTPRERETLQLIASGMLNKQAASMLGISGATLQVHRGRITYKMRARSFAELVRMVDALKVTSSKESAAYALARSDAVARGSDAAGV